MQTFRLLVFMDRNLIRTNRQTLATEVTEFTEKDLSNF